jgi:hypothetical protein
VGSFGKLRGSSLANVAGAGVGEAEAKVGSFGIFGGASFVGVAGAEVAKVGSFGKFGGSSLAGAAGADVPGVGVLVSEVGSFGSGGVVRRMWMFLKARWRMWWKRAS